MGIAVVVTRSCIGISDMLTGKLKTKLADSALGAIVTHAEITDNGDYIIAAESGFVIYWKVAEEAVIFKEEQKDILQVSVSLKNEVLAGSFFKLHFVVGAVFCMCKN